MNELQALVTGMIAGALTKADHESQVDIEVLPRMDTSGNYEPYVLVTGRQSGTRLLVAVIDLGSEE